MEVAKKYVGGSDGRLVVGLGEGRLPSLLVQCVAELCDGNVLVVPSSTRSAAEAAYHGLRIARPSDHHRTDVSFATVDELDDVEGSLPAITGRFRGEIHVDVLGEKRMALHSKKHIVFVEGDHVVDRLGGNVPVVIPAADWEDVAEELDDLFLGVAEIWRHPAKGTSDPRGGTNPYVSDAGHAVLDIRFEEPITCTPHELAEAIEGVPGVLGHGLLLDAIHTAYGVEGEGVKEMLPYLADVDRSIRKNLMGDS